MAEKILDIGCGTSNHLGIYENKTDLVVGIDLRGDFAQFMQGSHPQHAFAQADGYQLPFKEGSFGRVYLTSVLEHMECPDGILAESYRVLRNGGLLIADVPHSRYEAFMDKMSSLYHSKYFHRHVFQPSQIQRNIEDAGFTVLERSSRMWLAAIEISFKWLRAKIAGKVEFDLDCGELKNGSKPSTSSAFEQFLYNLTWIAENREAAPRRSLLLSPLRFPNLIYPWVTYIKAQKA